MTPKESIDWVVGIESRIDHLDFKYFGVDCWPIIRNSLLSMVFAKDTQGRKKLAFNFSQILRFIKSLCFIFKIKKCDTFFLTDIKYAEKINNKKYLKDIYVYYCLEKEARRNSLIALQSPNLDKTIVGSKDSFTVFPLIFFSALLGKILSFVPIKTKLDEYIKQVVLLVNDNKVVHCRVLDNKNIIESTLRKNILYCVILSWLFSSLLLVIRPQVAFVVCYYSLVGMAFCTACKKRSIYVSDVQHGVSGRYVRAYGRWSCPHRGGYSTFPDAFLTWTDFDANAIKEWSLLCSDMPRVEKISTLWRSHMIESGLYEVSLREWADFFKKTSRFKRKIVITLQFLSVSDYFLDFINKVSDDYCFFIRFHPDFELIDCDIFFSDLFKDKNNVFYLEPTVMPISLLMSNSDLHITEWSSSVYDAYFEGVFSIVTTGLARDYFADFIDHGNAIYADSNKMIFKYL